MQTADNAPLVSVITPVYNAERFIGACIESMLAQSYENWEQIIVDDGSSDATGTIVARYADPRIHYIRLPHRGLTALAETYNTALQAAQGELIGVLEGDDEWSADKLTVQVRAFADPQVMMSWGRSFVADGSGRVTRRWPMPRSCRRDFSMAELFRVLARWNVLSPALTVMVRRSALTNIGGFQQTGSSLFVDLPTWLTLAGRIGGQARYIDRELGVYRIYESNTGTVHNARMRVEHDEVFQEIRAQLGEARLRELGWNARDDRITEASANLTRGIAYLQTSERDKARAAFAATLKRTRSPGEFATAMLGWTSALTGFNMIERAQRARASLARIARVTGMFAIALCVFNACEKTTVDPLASARLEIVTGGQQTGAVATQLQPVTVKLVDGSGGALRGVVVDWNVLEGGGTIDSVQTLTDQTGVTTVHWRLGLDPGPQTLLARTRTASIAVRATAVLKFMRLAAGYRHTCGIATSNQTYCWGDNSKGQLGADVGSSATPIAAAGRIEFAGITAGWFHTCGLTRAGDVYCWGENSVGQLGSAGTSTTFPRRVASSEKFAAVSAGYQQTCALTTTGVAYCWGNDGATALGALPQRVNTNLTFKDIAAGEFHQCAVGTDGNLYCWGSNSNGQLGANLPADAVLMLPVRAISNRLYRAIGAGSRHNCALTTDGTPECWGRNGAGETGLDQFVGVAIPVPMSTALRFSTVDGGETNTCGLATDQRAYCWGSELGTGAVNSKNPVAANLPTPVTDVSVGFQHVCAIAASEVWCWTGSNMPVRVQ